MPKRKRLPDTPTCIQKSNPLLSLTKTGMSLPELKILDVYLSQIDSHKPDKRTVLLSRGKIESLLGLSKISQKDLEARVTNLFKTVTIQDKTTPKGFRVIGLFEMAECETDETGSWQIALTCTPAAMEYVFNIEHLGYLKYTLKNVVNLTSRYSYCLFLYLERNRRFGSWEVNLQVLKETLNCTASTYNTFKRFNDLVLKKSYKELNEKTDCKFEYAPVKKGKYVIGVRFTLMSGAKAIETEKEEDAIPGQMDIYDYPEIAPDPDNSEDDIPDIIRFYRDACPGFSVEEMQQIVAVLAMIPDHKLPDAPGGDDDVELRQYHYLCERYAALNVADKRSPIRNKFAYFVKMLKADAMKD